MMDTKPIAIKAGQVEHLTFDEIYERYNMLVRKKAKSLKGNHEHDEVFQEASIGLWEAYQGYDAKHTVGFGLFAQRCIDHRLWKYNHQANVKIQNKTSKVQHISSLNRRAEGYDGEASEIIDLIIDDVDQADKAVDRILVKELLALVTDKQRQNICYILQGYSYSDIARMKKVSSASIQQSIKGAYEKMKKAAI